MTKSKTIVIWGGDDVLSSSIELFLAAEENWNVFSICFEDGLDALNSAIETSHPDFVIIHKGFQNNPGVLPLQLLQDHPTIKVIIINLDDNLMDVYSQKKILVNKSADLISVIEQEP